jgi:hypothetical protein
MMHAPSAAERRIKIKVPMKLRGREQLIFAYIAAGKFEQLFMLERCPPRAVWTAHECKRFASSGEWDYIRCKVKNN